MSDIAISVERLSKRYLIGRRTERERYVALRDVMMRSVRNFARRSGDMLRGRQIIEGDSIEDFWALRDVSFEVRRGEVIGIIGRNGAGKSTLLKILSRITEPTEGRARLKGRVASLLEVGTGFHPELTGRENIYLNGAVLGMSRADIRRRFDEIVAFADVDDYLDTPVKRYSSGMHVRLAFAVAAHLEPEILVVDEVLAVGDAEFQKKCIGRMDAAAKDGRTVLLVSHDMRRVASLCGRGILLNAGRVVRDGGMSEVIDAYLARRATSASADLRQRRDVTGSGDARFQSLELFRNGRPATTFEPGDAMVQRFEIKVTRPVRGALVSSSVSTADGVLVLECMNNEAGFVWNAERGTVTLAMTIDRLNLCPGAYAVDLWIGDRNMRRIDYARDAIGFTVAAEGSGGIAPDRRHGTLVYQKAQWSVEGGPERTEARALETESGR
jgi:lipopolysaccharide transport system ATP-binding protein